MPSATNTAPKGVSSGRLCDELNGCRLAFLDLEAVPRRRENKAGISCSFGSLRERPDFEAMRVVAGSNLELDFRALLDPDRRWIELVFLCGHFDNLNALLCAGRRARGLRDGAAGEREGRNY